MARKRRKAKLKAEPDSSSQPTFSATRFARLIGTTNDTVAKRLHQAGLSVESRKEFTLRELVFAYFGNLQTERIRETRARADLLELKRRERAKELVPLEQAHAVIIAALDPLKSQLVAMPAELAARCNPSDPDHARIPLEEWVDRTLCQVSS